MVGHLDVASNQTYYFLRQECLKLRSNDAPLITSFGGPTCEDASESKDNAESMRASLESA